MSGNFALEDISKWKNELEIKIAQIDSTLKEKEKRLETLESMMYVVDYSSKKFSISKDVQESYWNKYGKPLEDESVSLSEEQHGPNNELKKELRELQCLLTSVNEYVRLNTDK